MVQVNTLSVAVLKRLGVELFSSSGASSSFAPVFVPLLNYPRLSPWDQSSSFETIGQTIGARVRLEFELKLKDSARGNW